MSHQNPITCDEALRRLAAFLDGELQGESQKEVEHHMELCRSCFSRGEFERRLKAEVRHLGDENVPPGFKERVQRLLGSFASSSAAEPADGI
jgi:anti-sigma factor (TIGR02949 family)